MKVSEAGRERVATKAARVVKLQKDPSLPPPHTHPPIPPNTHTNTLFDCKTFHLQIHCMWMQLQQRDCMDAYVNFKVN